MKPMPITIGGEILFLFCVRDDISQTHPGTQEAEPLVKGLLFPGVHPAKQ